MNFTPIHLSLYTPTKWYNREKK